MSTCLSIRQGWGLTWIKGLTTLTRRSQPTSHQRKSFTSRRAGHQGRVIWWFIIRIRSSMTGSNSWYNSTCNSNRPLPGNRWSSFHPKYRSILYSSQWCNSQCSLFSTSSICSSRWCSSKFFSSRWDTTVCSRWGIPHCIKCPKLCHKNSNSWSPSKWCSSQVSNKFRGQSTTRRRVWLQ